MIKFIMEKINLKNSQEYVEKMSAEIKKLTEQLDDKIITSFYNEMLIIKEEKKQIVERFYNKINFLISISSILLSGNLLLFTFIYQEKILVFSDYKIIAFLASTCLIFISLMGLLFSLSFKSIFHSMNEKNILFAAGKLKSESMIKRMMISAIALSNVLNSAVYERIKKRMKILFYFLISAVFLMVSSTPSILILNSDKENNLSINKLPIVNIEKPNNDISELINGINSLYNLHEELINTLKEIKMAESEKETTVEPETVEQQISIPDPAGLLNLHTESLDIDSEVIKTTLNENTD